MGQAGEAVTDEDFVLRRIPLSKYDPSLPEAPIERDQFLGRNDPDGLSVYRESIHRDNPERILDAVPEPEKRKQYIVVKLPTAFLFAHGFTLIEDPCTPVEGHCLIPEIKQERYRADKSGCKEIAVRLSKIAEIVYTPPGFSEG